MTTLLTEEQRKKVEEFLSIVKVQKETIQNSSLKSNFEVSAVEAKKSIEEINYIVNDDFYRTQELFFIEEDTGEYGADALKYITEVRNPFTLIDKLLKESTEPNVGNLISVEYNYNNIIKPYLEQNFGVTFDTYSETYYTIPLTQLQKVSEGTEEYNEIINNFSKLITCLENNEFNQAVNIITNLLTIHNNIVKAFIPTIYIISYFLYVGNVTSQSLDYGNLYENLYQSPDIFLNENFAKQTISLSDPLKKLFNNISSLNIIKNELELLNSERFEDIKELIRIKAIEDEDIEDLTNFKNKIKTINSTVDSFKSNYETLTETIQNVLDNEDNYYNQLINLTNPTEKQNTIDAAKASGYNVFQYIFHSDARLISLYNEPAFRDLNTSDYINYGPYSATYYEDWKSDYEKLIEGKSNYINLKNKLEEINSYFETEKLLENDIIEISSKISDLVFTLRTEVLPSVRTLYGHLSFIEGLNTYSELTGVSYTPELYTPFYRKDQPEGVETEQMVVHNLTVAALTQGVTPITDLITTLETLQADLKKDTIQDLLNIESGSSAKALNSVTSILERIESQKSVSGTLCQNIESVASQPLTKYINFESNAENLNIYNLMYTESSVAAYNKMKDSLIHDYSPLNTKISNGVSEKIKDQTIEINKSNWYKRWCEKSTRLEKEYDNRFDPLKEEVNNLKLAIEEADQTKFNESRVKALNIIEQDLHPDIALYFIFTEIYDVNNSNNRIKTNSELYVKDTVDFNFDEIASLKFTSFDIIKELIELHKAITNLEFSEELKEISKVFEEATSRAEAAIKKRNEEIEKEAEKPINLPKENWGIRISPANAFTSVNVIKKEPSVDDSGKPTKEQEVNTTVDVFKQETTAFGKSWYMMLLPTMTSNLPVTGGSQAPGAQPGLNFKIVNSLVKHKIPGFGPVYQPMGIDTINCTIVGCFTGADGTDKYKIGTVDNFSDGGYNYSNDLFGLNGEIGNQSRFLDDVVHRFDSFENFQTFYNEIIQTNKEIEVEINLKKNTNVLANGSEGIFRDSTTGNPKFKGFIKRFDSYYIRDDRTWYIMDVQLTTNHIISKKCLNLTNIVEEAVPTTTLEESLGVTPFNLIAECLFKDTPGVGGPPTLPELIEFGPGNDARRVFLGSRAGEYAVNWKGVTVQQKGKEGSKRNRLSINKEGYSVKYEIIKRGDNSNYRILGKPYLTPSETYKEIQNEVWDVDLKMLYIITFNCIKDFLSRPAPNSEQLIDPIDSPVIELHKGLLKNKEVANTGNSNQDGILNDGDNINLIYNKITGNLLERDRSFKEYNPKVILDPKPLHKGVFGQGILIGGVFAGGDRAVRYKKHIELFNVLNAEALLEFNKNEEIEEDCKNKSKKEAKALSKKDKVDTTNSNDPKEIDIGVTFTKNDLQTKLKTYIENNHKEFISQQVITYNNSNKSRLYFIEDIRNLSYLEEVSSQFFVDKFKVVDNEDSYFNVEVETKSSKGIRYVAPANTPSGSEQEPADKLIITIEKKDNKVGRILRTIPYSQYTKPTQTQR